jgi:hypothetical protein
MTKKRIALAFALIAGCGPTVDPALVMVDRVDHMPPEDRPGNWAVTRALMLRAAPIVGQEAPDFALPSMEGDEQITRSTLLAGRPQVLIFGSWT